VITGAAGVLGKAAAELLAARDFACVLADRDAARLAQVGEIVPRSSQVVADMTDAAAVAALFADAPADLRAIVLGVGAEGPVGPIESCEDAAFHEVMTLNVASVWLGLKHGVAALKARGGGSIVVLASISGVMGMPMMSAYAASKHAVMGLVRSVAREAAASGVRINAVCPGPTASPLMARVDAAFGRAQAAQSVPLQRYAQPAEVAEMVAFLCSEASSYSTGSSFMLDGGYSCR